MGLYLDPPEKALMLAADEKSQIQALDRSQPLLPMRPGRASWLNLVEAWFATLTPKQIKRDAHCSTRSSKPASRMRGTRSTADWELGLEDLSFGVRQALTRRGPNRPCRVFPRPDTGNRASAPPRGRLGGAPPARQRVGRNGARRAW